MSPDLRRLLLDLLPIVAIVFSVAAILAKCVR